MKKILQLSSAFIGVIAGAGFASGQEILQYFTSFGLMGTVAAVISTALFGYLGYVIMRVGSFTRATSHHSAINKISGRFVGTIVDCIIIITLFGTGVVMIAGAGSSLNQQLGFDYPFGTTVMAAIVLVAGMAKIDQFVKIIGSITPYLIFIIVVLAVYSLFTIDSSLAELNATALAQDTTLPNWIVSAINYVSFNIALGASMAIVMGGNEKDDKIAAYGGLIGGLGIGFLIILSHFTIFTNINSVQGYEMPLLAIANGISPYVGFFMSMVIFGLIFNTAAAMFFAFASRFSEVGTKKFKIIITSSLVIAYILSYVGFTDLVSMFYPFVGYIGIFLVGALIAASFRFNKINPYHGIDETNGKVILLHKRAEHL